MFFKVEKSELDQKIIEIINKNKRAALEIIALKYLINNQLATPSMEVHYIHGLLNAIAEEYGLMLIDDLFLPKKLIELIKPQFIVVIHEQFIPLMVEYLKLEPMIHNALDQHHTTESILAKKITYYLASNTDSRLEFR